MEEQKEHDKGLWVLWAIFLLGLAFYAVVAQGHQEEAPPLDDPGPRMAVVWVLGGFSILCAIGLVLLKRLPALGILGKIGQWCLCHVVAMAALALAFLKIGPTYWIVFMTGATLLMLYSIPRKSERT